MVARAPTPAGSFYQVFYRWSSISSGNGGCRIYHKRQCTRRADLSYTVWNPSRSHSTLQSRTIRNARPFGTTTARQSNQKGADPDSTAHEQLPAEMRRLMRRIPHPVVILTATHPPSPSSSKHSSSNKTDRSRTFDPTDAEHFRAMTISSFNTVCLEPYPVVSFNMKLPSRTYEALQANEGYFLIHLLGGGPGSARLADGFTRGQEEARKMLGLVAAEDRMEAPVDVVGDDGTRLSPMMVGPPVTSVLRCRLLPGKELHVEDHVVLCAQVLGLSGQSGDADPVAEAGYSLVYVDRAFRHVGETINWRKEKD